MNLSPADVELLGTTSYSYMGTELEVGDMDGDGQDDLLTSAPNTTSTGSNRGLVWLVAGPLTAGTVSVSSVDTFELSGNTAYDGAGTAIGWGDVDGDGVADFLVSAPYRDVTTSNDGTVYLLYGG